MLSFAKESTHYLIIANIWLAAMILAEHSHDMWFAVGGFAFWVATGFLMSRREREL